jgi:hypothetical protein
MRIHLLSPSLRLAWVVCLTWTGGIAAGPLTDACVHGCQALAGPTDPAQVTVAQCTSTCLTTYSDETGLGLAAPANDWGTLPLDTSPGVTDTRIFSQMDINRPPAPTPPSVADMCAQDCAATSRSAATIQQCLSDCLGDFQVSGLDPGHVQALSTAPPAGATGIVVSPSHWGVTVGTPTNNVDVHQTQQEAQAAWQDVQRLQAP